MSVFLCVALLLMSQKTLAQYVGYSDPWTSYRSQRNAWQPTLGSAVPVGHVFSAPDGCPEDQPVCTTACRPCQGPCDETGRRFAVTIQPGFAFRSAPRPQQLFSSAGTGAGVVDASQFAFGLASALDLGFVIYDPRQRTDVEFRTSFVDLWSDATAQALTGGVVQVAGNPPLATSGPRNAVTAYTSQFGSWEINARHHSQRMPGLTWLTGFRAFRLDERLSGRLTDPAGVLPDEVVQSSVRNRLYGFQLGGDYTAFHDRCWCLRFTGRIGLYGNQGSHSGQLLSLATPAVSFPATGDDSTLAFHCETGVEARWRFQQASSLVLSYQVSVLDGLGLASEQPAATNFLSQSGYHSNGTIVLHSLTAGVELFY